MQKDPESPEEVKSFKDECWSLGRNIDSIERIFKVQDNIFEDLFVLELANNHWGKLERGL